MLQEEFELARHISRQCYDVANNSLAQHLVVELARAHSMLALLAHNTRMAKHHLKIALQLLSIHYNKIMLIPQGGDICYYSATIYIFHGIPK